MALKRNLKVEKIVELIENDPNIVFVGDICEALPVASSTFYTYFPSASDEYKKIDEALENNKSKKKKEIRDRLMASNSAASLIFLYKLLTKDIKERAQLDGRVVLDDRKDDDAGDITLIIE